MIRCFPDKLPIGIKKDDMSRFVFLYLVNRRLPLGLPPVPFPSRGAVPLPPPMDRPIAPAATLPKGGGALQGSAPRRALDSSESERGRSLETSFANGSRRADTSGSVRSLHCAGVPKTGHAEDQRPLPGLATIGRSGSPAVVLDVLTRRLVLWPFGGRDSATEPPVPPAHGLDRPGCVGQERGEAKFASGWPPGFDVSPDVVSPLVAP